MEAETKFKLIRAIDPTKIHVPLKDAFAKLTLSSNKKTKIQKPLSEEQLEKRQNVSRNLLTAIQASSNEENVQSDRINALLRSESSSKGCEDELEETYLSGIDDVSKLLDYSNNMETLHVTDESIHHTEIINEENMKTEENKGKTDYAPNKEKEITICIPSSGSEGSYDVISLTDSSLEEEIDAAFDFNLMTSDIPESGATADVYLPCTFSNDKADRMEAFLRDISQHQKQKQLANYEGATIATADTMSMDLLENEFKHAGNEIQPSKSAKQNYLFDDTIAMNQTLDSVFTLNTQERRSAALQVQTNEHTNDSRRLANDETQMNTELNDTNVPNYEESGTNSHSNSVPDHSMTISETCSESEEAKANENAAESNELIPSDKLTASDKDDTPTSSQLSQMQFNFGSINISAKINIKIQISERSESNTASETASEENDEPPAADITPQQSKATSDSFSHATTSQQTKEKQVHSEKLQKDLPTTPRFVSADLTACSSDYDEQNDEDVDSNFLTHAEKLLTQLYGKSWQTPEVMRTLTRTSSSGKKENVSGKSTPSTSAKSKTTNKNENRNRNPTNQMSALVVEETVLDDFCLFRKNIEKTNLDSTRLKTPKPIHKTAAMVHANTDPRRAGKLAQGKPENNVFKVPRTETKKRAQPTRSGRLVEARWRELVDDSSDSEGENASDDDEPDQTNAESDKSWHKESSSEESESSSDTKQEPKNKSSTRATTKNEREKTKTKPSARRKANKQNSKGDLIYLDLSKDEVTILEGSPDNPPANNDENFESRLADILRTCRHEDKPRLEATPKTTKTKRKLFNPNADDDGDGTPVTTRPESRTRANQISESPKILQDLYNVPPEILPPNFTIFNKPLNAVKTGKPIFQITPPRAKNTPTKTPTTARTGKRNGTGNILKDKLCATPNFKYGFLKSLDACVSKEFCHPDALIYRDNYRQKKEELGRMLYDLYNEKLFDNELHVPLQWNKKLSNTAGRCLNKKKMGTRSCVVELSEKVLTSADRLRCTLIHEVCHAATWIFNGEGGHGNTWKEWARKANSVFPEIPKIGVCHQYDIEYKYTYKCTLCQAKSHAHSKSKKVENIRCSYCHGAIEIFLNKKDKDGNVMPTPVREPTGFAKFVKDNYKQHKRADLKHADIMKILSNEFAALKVVTN